MKTNLRLTILIISLIGLVPTLTGQETPKELTNMMQFIGKWEALDATMNMQGKEFKFTLYSDFEKTAGGSGVLMHEWADVPEMGKFDGQNLIGYDSIGKKLRWFTVNNAGTTHEHTVQWKADNEMHMEYSGTLDGKPYREYGTAVFKDANTVELNIIETLDGKEHSTTKAVFKRKM